MNPLRTGASRRTFLTSTIAATTAAALAACSNSGGQTDTSAGGAATVGAASLRMMAFGSTVRQKKLQQVLQLYTKKYGGSANLEIVANSAFEQKLATQIAGGSAADVLALFHNIVAQFAAKKALLSLDDYVPKILKIDNFDKSSIASGVIGGDRVSLPLGDNAYGVIYDQGAVEAAGLKVPAHGHTWSEFETFANDMSKKGGDGYYGTIDDSPDFNAFEVYVRQRGKQFFDSGKLAFGKDDVEAWFQIWADLRATGAAPPGGLTAQTTSVGYGQTLIVQGKAANFFIFPNVLNSVQSLTKSKLTISTIAMPSADKSGLYIRASNWVSAYSRTKHPADAVNLINFALNDAGAAKVLKAEFGAPPNLGLRKQLSYDAVDKIFIDYVDLVANKYAHPIPPLDVEFPDAYSQIANAFKSIALTVATGKASVSSGADQFVSQAQGYLG